MDEMGNIDDSPYLEETVKIEPFAFPPTLLGRLRSGWYDIAARWGIKYVIDQQNRINRIQREHTHAYFAQLQALERELSDSRRQIGLLAAEIKRLEKRIGRDDQTMNDER